MKAGFTTSADIIGPGTCASYWTFSADNWTKVNKQAGSTQIFDKISPDSKNRTVERDVLFSSRKIIPFNDDELFNTFFDKLQTYKELAEYAIPTIQVNSSALQDIDVAYKKLQLLVKNAAFAEDFSTDIVLKDRFGAGGNHVYKLTENFIQEIHEIMTANSDIHFILQPFLTFDQGFSYQGEKSTTDIRLIFQYNAVLQCYLRIAKTDDFRCNEHQGGQLIYVTEDKIPDSILTIAKKIVRKINKPTSLYALDFAVSNLGRVYFIEGNIGPGVDWNVNKKMNEKMSKSLIRSIVKELAIRVNGKL